MIALNRPPIWKNGPLTLYHGTLRQHVDSIQRGIDPTHFRPGKDFGRGFYLTTSLRQATSWADSLVRETGGPSAGVVLTFVIDREVLARLDTLFFVRGDYDAVDYWSFVWRCREQDDRHGRPVNGGWYDVVVGPVAAFWRKRACYQGGDQVSFHTPRAFAVLQQVEREGIL